MKTHSLTRLHISSFVVEFAGPFQGYKFFNTLPAYWEQGTHLEDNEWCAEFQGLDILTDEEKAVACKTQPRSIQDKEQLIDLDLLADVENNILTHNYDDGPFFQVFATQLMHTPLNYPKSFNEQDDSLPNHFKDGQEKPIADADDQRLATAKCIEFVDDVFGKTMQAIEDAGQWNNTVVYVSCLCAKHSSCLTISMNKLIILTHPNSSPAITAVQSILAR